MCVFGLTFLSEGWSEGQRGEKLVVVVVRLIRGTKGGARVVKTTHQPHHTSLKGKINSL